MKIKGTRRIRTGAQAMKPKQITKVSKFAGGTTTTKYRTKPKGLANKIRQISQKLNLAERKFIVRGLQYDGITGAGGFTHLTPVALGDTDTSRDGGEIIPNFLDVYLNWTYVTSGLRDHSVCRMIIFRWKDSVPPTNNDIFEALVDTTPLKLVNCPFVHNDRYKFDVLFDKKINIDENSYDSSLQRFKYTFPNQRIKYSGPGEDDIEHNSIYMALLADTSAGVSGATAEGYFKFYYNDY